RHFDAQEQPYLNNLSLNVYHNPKGNRMDQYMTNGDNVASLVDPYTGELVFKVKAEGKFNGTSESFGFAISKTGFTAATGPAFYVNCPSGPIDLAAPYVCTITNTGDLSAQAIQVTLNGGQAQFL